MREILLNKIAFTDTIEQSSTHQTILSFGEDFSGKTRLGVTGPSVIGIAPLDKKTRDTALKTKNEFGRHILLPKTDLMRGSGNISVRAGWGTNIELTETELNKRVEETKKDYRAHVNIVKDCVWALHDHKDVQLIMIDLFEQLCNDIYYAHYGRVQAFVRSIGGSKKFRDTKEADQEIVDFVNSLNRKHVVLLHRSKDEYVDDKATGRKVWSGYRHLGHASTLIIEHVVNKKYDPISDDPNKNFKYGLNIRKCLANVELEGPDGQVLQGGGLRDDFINFSTLMQMVYPATTESDWT